MANAVSVNLTNVKTVSDEVINKTYNDLITNNPDNFAFNAIQRIIIGNEKVGENLVNNAENLQPGIDSFGEFLLSKTQTTLQKEQAKNIISGLNAAKNSLDFIDTTLRTTSVVFKRQIIEDYLRFTSGRLIFPSNKNFANSVAGQMVKNLKNIKNSLKQKGFNSLTTKNDSIVSNKSIGTKASDLFTQEDVKQDFDNFLMNPAFVSFLIKEFSTNNLSFKTKMDIYEKSLTSGQLQFNNFLNSRNKVLNPNQEQILLKAVESLKGSLITFTEETGKLNKEQMLDLMKKVDVEFKSQAQTPELNKIKTKQLKAA